MNLDPELVPAGALVGKRVAISVSETADLARLGLRPAHLTLAIAELARALILSGASAVYGGRIDRGFTSVIRHEAESFSRPGGIAFEHVIPYSEHAAFDKKELRDYVSEMGVHTVVNLVNADGSLTLAEGAALSDIPSAAVDIPASLTLARNAITRHCDARVVVGGRLDGFAGVMPGVVEEALMSLDHGQPLFVAGGFGGASAFVGRRLEPSNYEWLPDGMPAMDVATRDALAEFTMGAALANGLSPGESATLAQTYRPSDIATLVVLGLSRVALS
jgi:hypothetical protein